MKKLDLIGQSFGKLTVVEYAGVQKDKLGFHGRTLWKCRCLCGNPNLITITGSNLKRRNSTSCGCKILYDDKYNSVNLLDKHFGKLVVIDKANEKTKSRGVLWVCKCDCGNIIKIPSNSLISGNTTTCGDRSKHPKGYLGYGDIPHSHLMAIQQGATKRKLPFSVTGEYLWNLFIEQNRRCALSGVELSFTKEKNKYITRATHTTASLDRINNFKGYIEGNVRWVHKDVNRMRWILSDDELLEWCKKIISFHNEK